MRLIMIGIVCLLISRSTVIADTMNFTPVADASAIDTGANGSFNTLATTSNTLSIRKFATISQSPFEERSLAEFNLTNLPAGAMINDVAFRFYERGFANSNTRVDIFGYHGNGSTTLADATASAALLGSYDPVAIGLGDHSIALSTTAFVGLLSSSQMIGLRFQGIESTNTQMDSLEGGTAFGTVVPTISVNFTVVPEPGAVGLLGIGLAAALARRRS